MRFPITLLLFLIFITENAHTQTVGIPYQTDFDQGSAGWFVNTPSGTAWELGTPNVAGSSGPLSAPNCWGTDLDSGYRAGSLTYLNSPLIVASNSTPIPYLTFFQFRYMSSGLDGMRVEYSLNNQPWTSLSGLGGDSVNWYNSPSIFSSGQAGFTGNSGGWVLSGSRLPSLLSGDSIRIRFVFHSNSSFGSAQPGIFIDNFSVGDSSGNGIDVFPLYLVQTGTTPAPGQAFGLQVIVKNQSLITVDSIRTGYSINGGAFNQQTIPFGLAPGIQDTFLFGTVSLPAGYNNIRLFATTNGDAVPGNDTINSGLIVVNSLAIPYFNDFESDTIGWFDQTVGFTRWEYGTPAYGMTSSAFSGTKCWDTDLDTAYVSNSYAILNSPSFNFSTTTAPYLEFALNCKTEDTWDGVRMEYSVNNGSTWFLLGSVGDPLAGNWYTDPQLNSSNLPAWEGQYTGWIFPKYRLSFLNGNGAVRFRFIFTSDGSINQDGVSIDDFRIDELPAYDISVDSVQTSTFSYPIGSNSGPVRIKLSNNGGQPASGFTVGYQVNGTTLFSQSFPGILNSGSSTYYTLPGFTVQQGIQNICAQISWNPDLIPSNNSFCAQAAGVPFDTLTYDSNFDSGTSDWVGISRGQGTTLTRWELGTPNYGLTASAHSAPNAWDINLDTAYAPMALCELYSPVFDLSTASHPELSFWQNRRTTIYADGLRIDYRLNQDTAWYVLGTYNDQNGTNWYNRSYLSSSFKAGWDDNSGGWIQCTYNLDSIYPGNGSIQFRFVFTSGTNSGLEGVSIDDFRLKTDYPNDAALTAVTSPQGVLISGVQAPINVLLKNEGSLTLTGLNIAYRINGGTINSVFWSGNLLRDSSVIVNLGTGTVIAGTNQVDAWISWPLDQYNGNDTIQSFFQGLPTQPLPYNEDFESGNGFWYNSLNTPSTIWEYGTPNFAPTNTAHSGVSCWDVNLNSPYGNLAFAALASPCFAIPGSSEVKIEFWENHRTEYGMDGAYLEYTGDGITWQVLGQVNDSLGTNWYNGPLYGGRSGWSGIGNGWTLCTYRFKPDPGTVALRLRFIFLSDPSVVDAGFSIDDVRLSMITGLEESQLTRPDIRLYPNPANKLINIALNDGLSGNCRIKIFDSKGSIREETEQHLQGSGVFTINTEQLESGVYWLLIQNEKGAIQKAPFVVAGR